MDRFFLTIIQMSITGSVAILAVLFLRLLLRRTPKIFSYALWIVVLFRFICPVALEGTFGIPQNLNHVVQENYANRVYLGTDEYTKLKSDSQNRQQMLGVNPIGQNVVNNNDTDKVTENMESRSSVQQSNHLNRLFIIGKYLWLVGMAVLLGYSLVSYYLLKRKLKCAISVEPNVYEMKNFPTPFVLGIVHPLIYLPTGLHGEEREYVLAHESMHIKRFDHVIKLIGFLVLILHWFHPLVWISFICMTKDMEMSCDEAVLRNFGPEIKKEYSTLLLHMAMHQSSLSFAPLAFSEDTVLGEGSVGSRIKNVLNYKKAGVGILVICICILIGATILLMTNQKAPGCQMKLSRTDTASIENSSVLQEYKLTDEANSYMVFAVIFQDGQEVERNLIAAENITEVNRQGEREIALEYSNEDDNHAVTVSVSEGASSNVQTYYLPGYTMRAGNVLWDEGKYHDLTMDSAYLILTEYIGYDNANGIEVFHCEDIMQDQSIWDAVMKQSSNSDIVTYMIYYVPSVKTAEELAEDLETFPLHTDTVELAANGEFPPRPEQMYGWRTQYIGNNSAVGNITENWSIDAGPTADICQTKGQR